MTPDEAIATLDAINACDPEGAHIAADDVLLAVVPPEVHEAYMRVVDRADWWASA